MNSIVNNINKKIVLMREGEIYENNKEGFLTNQWRDVYEKNKVSREKRIITKEKFEKYYGDYVSAIYIKESDDLPYCIWTKEYIVTFENHTLEIYLKSFPKNPRLIQFG